VRVRPAADRDDTPPNAVEIVAELSGRVDGTVAVWPESSGVYYATALHVDREHRRQGVGTALMMAAEEFARERGCQIRGGCRPKQERADSRF
jgi:GNAT superfamily N-acetyltransferase